MMNKIALTVMGDFLGICLTDIWRKLIQQKFMSFELFMANNTLWRKNDISNVGDLILIEILSVCWRDAYESQTS